MRKLKLILKILQAYLKPYKYMRKSGVNFSGKETVTLYTNPYKTFGSDPWMITLGDNVHITSGVRFITHDGGTLILRKEVPDNSVVVGVPAKVVKTTDEYLKKIKGESLHLGHLQGEEKAKELKKIYHINE